MCVPSHAQPAVEAPIGYAGRIVDDDAINEDNPKYRFPSDRARNGVVYEFRKSAFLYNGYRAAAFESWPLVIVEGFPSVWWLTQAGLPRVVATMGSSMSERQAELICTLLPDDRRVYVMPDGDRGGNLLAASVFEHLGPHAFVRWLKLDAGKQPTDYSPEELKQLVV